MIDHQIVNPELDRTIIFVHGLASNRNSFAPCIEYFKKDYRIFALSMRGHGRSERPQPESQDSYCVREMADDVAEVIEKYGLDSFHYVGHSMGGIIGYELLGRNADQFKTFTACGSPAEIRIPGWIALAGTLPLRALPEKTLRSTAGEVISRFSGKTEISKRILKNEVVPYINWRVMRHCMVNLSNFSYLNVLQKVKLPFLLIHGQHDIYNIYIKPVLRIMKGREDFYYEHMKGAGHNAHLDFPDTFNSTIEKFIKKYE
ncbi:MAG: alpha/beta hydrolase [Ignavibacteriae bacterium]|nr:alpha/beta hydrolase [Ignavibacteriota bacterium]